MGGPVPNSNIGPGIGAFLAFFALAVALYTVGAVVYGIKRPNPSPRWFGSHEVFHACTVAAFITHFVAVALAAYTVATG